jgi:hypothetical protein
MRARFCWRPGRQRHCRRTAVGCSSLRSPQVGGCAGCWLNKGLPVRAVAVWPGVSASILRPLTHTLVPACLPLVQARC